MVSSCVPKQEDSGSDLWFEFTCGKIEACVNVNNEDGASQDLLHASLRDLAWGITQRLEVSMVSLDFLSASISFSFSDVTVMYTCNP